MTTDAPGPLDTADTLALAGAALGEPLHDGVALGGSRRSLVLRASRAGGGTVVVKRYPRGEEQATGGFAREVVGLELLDGTPALLATDPAHRLLVMSDVGDHATLADLLRGDDPDAAWQGALEWAGALGALVADGRDAVERARVRLGGARDRSSVERAEHARAGLAALAHATGVPANGAAAEITTALGALAAAEVDVLSPGDTCPDNVLMTARGPVFVDLEATDVRPVAFDAAYAALPFATCWCVYAPPPGLTEAMLDAFAHGVRSLAPELLGEQWRETVVVAAAAWALGMAGVLLRYTDDASRRMGPTDAPALTMRELLLLRLDWVEREAAATLPETATVTASAAAALRATWGELPAPTFPAWSGCC